MSLQTIKWIKNSVRIVDRRRLFATALFIFFLISCVSALEVKHPWGGPGYDPAMKGESSRFNAGPHHKDANLFLIYVDSKETVNEVGQINLIAAEKIPVVSKECWKAMRHVMAPWACSFEKSDLSSLTGEGDVEVKNRSGVVVLRDKINFDAIRSFIDTSVP